MPTHWKKLTNPDFLGAYALDPGEDKTLTIARAAKESFMGNSGKRDEGIVIHWEENEKPMICNVTNAKAIEKVTGTPYIENWCGKRITLYAAEVSAFGETVDALRVRPFAPKEDIFCEDCGKPIRAANGKNPLAIAKSTKSRYGRQLCAECAKAAFEKQKEAQDETVHEGDI